MITLKDFLKMCDNVESTTGVVLYEGVENFVMCGSILHECDSPARVPRRFLSYKVLRFQISTYSKTVYVAVAAPV